MKRSAALALVCLLALGAAAAASGAKRKPKAKPKPAAGWTLKQEAGVRVPRGNSTEATRVGDTLRLWTHGDPDTGRYPVRAYTSTDGLVFERAPAGDPQVEAHDPVVVPLAGGGWRMYYVGGGPLTGKFLRSLRSSDGVAWTEEPGDRLVFGPDLAGGVPDAVVLPDGRIRLYYLDGHTGERIVSAVTSDGLTFARERGQRFPDRLVDPAVERLADGSWLALLATGPGSGHQVLYAATSRDGLAWKVQPKPVLDVAGAQVFDPTLVPLGGNRFRVYYSHGTDPEGPQQIRSGVLSPPRA